MCILFFFITECKDLTDQCTAMFAAHTAAENKASCNDKTRNVGKYCKNNSSKNTLVPGY